MYIEDKTFTRANFCDNLLIRGEYENCRFVDCDFSECDLSEFRFSDCEFTGCNLSLVQLRRSAFMEVKFDHCKMLGLHFDRCNEFGLSFSFSHCTLDYSTFCKTKIKKRVFRSCQLHEVDFSESDLSGSLFEHCDLSRATFYNTVLEKVDFRSALHYSIDPELNRLKGARFSVGGLAGLLERHNIIVE